MKALIIDDEQDICFLLGSILRSKNILPNYVNSIAEAKLALANQKPELIFLDNHLPDGMGVDFIMYIKKHHPKAKVLMITAYDTPSDRSKAFFEGADYFISKPFSRELIYQTLKSIAIN